MRTNLKDLVRRELEMVEVAAVFGHSDCTSKSHIFRHPTLKFDTL